MMIDRRALLAGMAATGAALPLQAQVFPPVGFGTPLGTSPFPPEVFAERRRKVVAKLGGGVAVVFGASRGGGGISAVEAPFFQDPDFAWLTGISDEPGAILVMARGERLFRETLLLPSRATRRPNAGTASACRSVPRSSAAPALRGCSGHRASARS
jgi:Xaa-Pro aminopeptidase